MKATNKKNESEIAKEWDDIALIRHRQIQNEIDTSFHEILLPSIINLIKGINKPIEKIIDIGCGTGYLTNKMSDFTNEITGIDISLKSIEIAKKEFKSNSKIIFSKNSINEFAEIKKEFYNLAIANMVLMDISDLEGAIDSVSKVLKDESSFIFTITHPFFWSKYWNYDEEEWFNYNDEIFIEGKFKISNESTDKITSHIHRPLKMYTQLLNKYDFKIRTILEPVINQNNDMTNGTAKKYPRFMIFHCEKN